MKYLKGKGLDFRCGAIITVVLEDGVTLTGTLLSDTKSCSHHRKPNFHKNILIQLTCPFRGKCGPSIPEGTFCAINMSKILFIIPGVKSDKKNDDVCQDKCDEKCHDDYDDKCDNDGKWGVTCHEKHEDGSHIINISCNRSNTAEKDA